jgi:hypothetical protein
MYQMNPNAERPESRRKPAVKKMRKFVHILAVMVSSLAAFVSHGKAQETTDTTTKKKDSTVTRHHRLHSDDSDASDSKALSDPPVHKRHLVASTESGDIKNSHHAATFSSYAQQTSEGEPAPIHLNPGLMATAERSAPSLVTIVPQSAPPELPGDAGSRYPWKREIVTTTFWVGETATQNNPVPNSASCWDPHWSSNYGGSDTPDTNRRTGEYIPAAFTPQQNPFYVALPYNDMEHGTHKAEASQVIPWFASDFKGPSTSVCQGRWIAIRYNGRVCYAQWEDAGPFRTDHWQYVFGKERPRWNLNGGAGLDVSPAVRDYLGMKGTDVTDWKFVDFDEVQGGPWARFGDNNTFVQNSRKSGAAVAELLNNVKPLFRSLFSHPGHGSPAMQ